MSFAIATPPVTETARFKLAAIGAMALLAGLVFYLALTHTADPLVGVSLGPLSRSSLGIAGGALPTFLHGLGFALLMIAVAAPQGRAGVIAICLLWVGTLWVFELLQPGGPGHLAATPSAGHTVDWLWSLAARGRFDWADMAASVLASLAAYLLTQVMCCAREDSNLQPDG